MTEVVLVGLTDSAGSGEDDVWVTRRTAEGGIIWDYTFGGTQHDAALAVLALSGGGLAVAGETNSNGAGLNDMWLLKLRSNGTKYWDRTYGTSKAESANALAVSPNGHLLLAGFTGDGPSFFNPTVVRTDANGSKQAQHTVSGSVIELVTSLTVLEDGDYLIAGGSRAMGIGNTDMRVTRMTSSGAVVWDRGFGSSGPDAAYDAVATEEGGIAVVGSVDSHAAWILLDSAGRQCGE